MRRRFTERNLAVSPDGDRVSREELESERTIFSHELIPVYGERLSYFIAGPPGCGKSTTAAQILSLFPHSPIFLFSDVIDDRAFDGLNIKRMKMQADLLTELKPEMLSAKGDCWVVFDDIDKIRDPRTSKALIALMDNIIANGRSHGGHTINVIATSHSLSDYRKTKYMIENCEYWVIFPSKTISSQLKRLLSKMDLDSSEIKKYDRCFIHQSVPSFLVTDDFITILD